MSREVAEGFALQRPEPNQVLMYVQGRTGVDVSALSRYGREDELQRGTTFTVLDKYFDPASELWIVKLEEAAPGT